MILFIVKIFYGDKPKGKGERALRKKTYMFDDETLDLLNELKCNLNKKEVGIIKEALKMYYEVQCNQETVYKSLNDIVSQLNMIVTKIEKLSYELGQCRERNRYLENYIKNME